MIRVPSGMFASLVAAAALLAACGGGEQKQEAAPRTPPAAQVPGGPLTPAPGGEIIRIEMLTDDAGNNKFVPNEFAAHQGDVLRFVLVSGVHNVNFLPDSNSAARGLPAASPLLQAPGQTFDIAVDFQPGRYYFQCDPHALLGMIGHVKVEAEDR
jgi:plastocyanin